ncbi:contactin-associated protein-like 2 [Grus japonensis]|uniref:Contactin-associated protein-like 2 n=1 Tax=Grus japonensis TaxID=30415 RepID=A0ABC9WF36_GRUJA
MNDSDHSLFQHSFQGCMQFIHVDDQLVDLHAVEQGQLGSFANVTIDMCAIIDSWKNLDNLQKLTKSESSEN